MKTADIFIFAGEQSGDLHGEQLITALLEKNPHLKIVGVGGPKMRSVKGFECVFPMEKFHVMGFIDVLIALPKLIYQFYLVKRLILQANPKKVLFIDYPDFNLRLAKSLKKSGFAGKIAHYICPSVWAWRKNRIFLMEKVLDTLFCILPFEKTYFENSSLDVKYVGHPLIKRMEEYPYTPVSFPKGKKVIGIFPGSRQKEIALNFPVQLEVMKALSVEYPDLHFVVSISHSKFFPLIEEMVQKQGLNVEYVDQNKNYDLMRSCHLAIAKSGTITLELALHKVPTVVVYGIAPLDLFIARTLLKIKLPFYALPNIIYQGSLFPELFGPHLTKETVYKAAKDFLLDESCRNECLIKCDQLYNILKNKDPDGDIATVLIR
jgi:lipid-A-disaccharide synthase